MIRGLESLLKKNNVLLGVVDKRSDGIKNV